MWRIWGLFSLPKEIVKVRDHLLLIYLIYFAYACPWDQEKRTTDTCLLLKGSLELWRQVSLFTYDGSLAAWSPQLFPQPLLWLDNSHKPTSAFLATDDIRTTLVVGDRDLVNQIICTDKREKYWFRDNTCDIQRSLLLMCLEFRRQNDVISISSFSHFAFLFSNVGFILRNKGDPWQLLICLLCRVHNPRGKRCFSFCPIINLKNGLWSVSLGHVSTLGPVVGGYVFHHPPKSIVRVGWWYTGRQETRQKSNISPHKN